MRKFGWSFESSNDKAPSNLHKQRKFEKKVIQEEIFTEFRTAKNRFNKIHGTKDVGCITDPATKVILLTLTHI